MNTEKEELMQKAVELNRAELGSIDLKGIMALDEELLSDNELMERASSVEIFYNNYLQKVIKLLTQHQLEEIGCRAPNESYIFFHRGTINGLALIDDWCKAQVNLSRSRFPPEEGKPQLGHI